MKTHVLFGMLAILLLPGCGDDLLAVHGGVGDNSPKGSEFHTVLADQASMVVTIDQLPTDANGNFDVYYTDGSRWHGNIDLVRATFDATLDDPYAYVRHIHDNGTFARSGGAIKSATYTETRSFSDLSTPEQWVDRVTVSQNEIVLTAHEKTRGTDVSSTSDYFATFTQITEAWLRGNVFAETVHTRYFTDAGGTGVHQSWSRDAFATTAVNPDRTADFVLNGDGSGSGQFKFFYSNGIYAFYDITINADFSFTEAYQYEDPATAVSPDGQGNFSFAPDLSGTGTYDEHYTDGSLLHVDDQFFQSGGETSVFTFDDASTAWAPDLDGLNNYDAQGGGNGLWHVDSASGIVETCNYVFDASGTLGSLACAGGASSPVSAPMLPVRATDPLRLELRHPRMPPHPL